VFEDIDGEEERRREARFFWELAIDHWEQRNIERHVTLGFYHNSNGVGQWDEADLDFLEEQGRPALSFNLTKKKVNAYIGMQMDAMQKPVVRAVGGEDAWKAEVWNNILDRLRNELDMDTLDCEVAERGHVIGEGCLNLDVVADPDRPAHLKIEATFVDPLEVKWDPNSQKASRKDAQYFFWDKWLTRSDFKLSYPDHAHELDYFMNSLTADENSPLYDPDSYRSEPTGHHRFVRDDYDMERLSRYYDIRNDKVRVIHMEFITAVARNFLVGRGQNGEEINVEISDQAARVIRSKRGKEQFPGFDVVETWKDQVHWFEFVRDVTLFDEIAPVPFDGWSIIPFSLFVDTTDKTSYGWVRDFIDPQREVNKSYSQSLDHLITQSKPGWIAEKGAIPDENQFEESINTGGSIAIVEKGALTGQQVRERQPAVLPAGAYTRHQASVELFDRIGGVATDVEQTAAGARQEAAYTVHMRHQKALVAMKLPFAHYAQYQLEVTRRLMQIVTRTMPDEQIERLLSNVEKFKVHQGTVWILEPAPPQPGAPGQEGASDPTGPGQQKQMVPVGQVPIRDLREMQYDIELDTTTHNTTLRLLEMQALAELKKMGVPVDDTLIVEKATTSRHERERLVEFAKERGKAQAAAEKAQTDQLNSQVAQAFKISEQEVAEKRRHNIIDEAISALKNERDAGAKIAAIWEKSDEAEKAQLFQILNFISDQQLAEQARTASPTQGAT
jgi:hypothetical protein